MDKFTRCFAEIDLDAIRHNFRELRTLCGEETLTMAVVKADGYGHGAVEVARGLRGMADRFAVASVEEALELRDGGIEEDILVLGYCDEREYEDVFTQSITTTVYTLADGERLSSFAESKATKIKIHLAVDTGMSRIGFPCSDEGIRDALAVCRLPYLEVEGIFSHYAKADTADREATQKQTDKFDSFIAALEEQGITIPIPHICNSAGLLTLKKHYAMVRMGIALYGAYPSDEVADAILSLRPAMAVKAHIIHVKTLPAHREIGYGGAYKTEKETRVATLSIGYADGYKRALSCKSYVLIAGKRAPLLGRVCMDLIMVDVTDIPEAETGMLATVMGIDGDEEITADYLGGLSESFSYEIFCSFSPRVKRIYKGATK